MTIIINRKHQHDSMVKYEYDHKCLEAIEFALDGKWDAAHEIIQALYRSTWAEWIHAVLHKIEGDKSNSRYWYNRSGLNTYESYKNPDQELLVIKEDLFL